MGTVNTNDPVEVARQLIREALDPFFKGPRRAKRMQDAANSAINSIVHLIKTTPGGKKIGAAVMTETASQKNPHTGKHNVPPRIL